MTLELIVRVILIMIAAYGLVGVAFTGIFLTRWIGNFDPSAVDGSRGFRLLIVPGLVALWPLVLMKIFTRTKQDHCSGAETLRQNHRLAFIILAIMGILLFTAAMVWRAPTFDELPKTEIPRP